MPEDFVVDSRFFLDKISSTPDTSLPDSGKINWLSQQSRGRLTEQPDRVQPNIQGKPNRQASRFCERGLAGHFHFSVRDSEERS